MTKNKMLKVKRSLIDPQALAEALKSAYGFQQAYCRLFKAMITDTYQVWADNKRYMLRVYRHRQRSRAQIDSELAVLDHLKSQGLPVPEVMTRRLSEVRVIELNAPEGRRLAILMHYVPGKPLNLTTLNPTNARQAGELIAKTHRAFDALEKPVDRPLIDADLLLREPLRAIKSSGLMAHRGLDLAYLHRTVSVLNTQLVSLPQDSPVFGMCHGDIDTSNMILTAENRLALIDLDYSGESWRAYDIASFMSDATLQHADESIKTAFIEGYESVRPLADAEKTSLPVLRAARMIWMIGLYAANVDEWGSFRLPDRFIDQLLMHIRESMTEIQAEKTRKAAAVQVAKPASPSPEPPSKEPEPSSDEPDPSPKEPAPSSSKTSSS